MFVDAQQLEDNTTLSGSIAIIGGGAAGITVAVELASQFKDVILLESGGWSFEQDTQELYDGPVLGHNNTNLDRSRLRFLGGTTNHWAGVCAQLDEVDFKRVGARPFSGWPIKSKELTPFYQRAFNYCQLGAYHDNSNTIAQAKAPGCQIVESNALDFGVFRHSPPTRFAEHFRAALESDRTRVYLHANVTGISIADNGASVSSLDVQTLTGRKLTVKAPAYVLCCGGIENARILLGCTRFFQTGIGNEYDLVGRFFMDHLRTFAGTILPLNETYGCPLLQTGDDAGTPVEVVLKNTAEAIERQGRVGCSVRFHPVFQGDPIVVAARRSPAYVAFRELAHTVPRGGPLDRTGDQVCEVLDDLGAVAIALWRSPTAVRADAHRDGFDLHGRPRTLDTRAPSRNRAVAAIRVELEGEQTPNPDSRVVLTNQVDALGMKRAGLDWHINEEDRHNLYQTAMALAQGVGAAGFGRMLVDLEQSVGLEELKRLGITWAPRAWTTTSGRVSSTAIAGSTGLPISLLPAARCSLLRAG